MPEVKRKKQLKLKDGILKYYLNWENWSTQFKKWKGEIILKERVSALITQTK